MVAGRNYESVRAAAGELEKLGAASMAVQCDVALRDEAEQLVSLTIERFGRIDILVNNAGITRDRLILRMSESDWDSVMAVNLKECSTAQRLSQRRCCGSAMDGSLT